ncbi:MAG: lysoplasmalogenase [Treponema sp.]|nr:lysoplasmalogenase [Treponema sp.]
MSFIFGGIFAAAVIVHLSAVLLGRKKTECISKIFLLPPLLAAYITGSHTMLVTVILAAAAGWAGDVFLLGVNKPLFFRLGLASFLLGHLFYIPSMLRFTGGVSAPLAAVSAAVFSAAGAAVYRWIRPPGGMRIPVVFYEITIMLMSMTALQLFLSEKSPASAAVFAGSLLFLASDCMLARFLFNVRPKWGDFAVMASYIAAQTAIVSGLAVL